MNFTKLEKNKIQCAFPDIEDINVDSIKFVNININDGIIHRFIITDINGDEYYLSLKIKK